MELFAQSVSYNYEVSSSGGGAFFWLLWLGICVVAIVALWKVFEKAGYDGWKSIVPLYNAYILFEIAGMNGWMFLLMFIPFVNFVVAIYLSLEVAKAFGKSAVFGVFGLFFFSFIGYLMLGYGDAKYVGAGAADVEETPSEE